MNSVESLSLTVQDIVLGQRVENAMLRLTV